MLQELADLSRILFSLREGEEKELFSELNIFSEQFNIQVKIYTDSGLTFHAKSNRFTDALVISLYQKLAAGTSKYYSLYHTNYNRISQANLNCSTEYVRGESSTSDIRLCEEFIREILGAWKYHPQEAKNTQELRNNFYELKIVSGKTWSFEETLVNCRK